MGTRFDKPALNLNTKLTLVQVENAFRQLNIREKKVDRVHEHPMDLLVLSWSGSTGLLIDLAKVARIKMRLRMVAH